MALVRRDTEFRYCKVTCDYLPDHTAISKDESPSTASMTTDQAVYPATTAFRRADSVSCEETGTEGRGFSFASGWKRLCLPVSCKRSVYWLLRFSLLTLKTCVRIFQVLASSRVSLGPRHVIRNLVTRIPKSFSGKHSTLPMVAFVVRVALGNEIYRCASTAATATATATAVVEVQR